MAREITAAISASSMIGRRGVSGCRDAALRGRLVELRLHLRDLVADARRLLVVLGADGGVLVRLEVGEPRDERGDIRLHAEPQAQPRPGLVDEVDGLVGQHAVGEVPRAELDGRPQRGIRVLDTVVLLVRGLESVQDQHGVLDRGLPHLHRLEPALERGVLLDGAVLLERGRTHEVQLAAREARLQDVARVGAAVARAARADHGVDLIDEDDELALVRGDLLHGLGEALLEVAAVAGAGEHAGQVERDHSLAEQGLGHRLLDDRAGEALDDRGLADAGLADQHGVVLRAAAEDLDGLLDLVDASDHRVELAVLGEGGEVGAELVEHRGLGCRGAAACGIRHALCALSARGDGLAHALREGLGGDAGARQHLAGGGILPQHEREEEVLGVDVRRAGRARDLVRVEQRAAGARRDRGRVDVSGLGCRGQARLGRGDEPLGGDADALDGLLHAVVLRDHAQDVQGVELGLAALEREASCLLQDALRAGGQEPAEVDRPSLTRLLTREIPGQELVERVRAGFGVEVFGHQSSWELELGTLKFNAEGARVFPRPRPYMSRSREVSRSWCREYRSAGSWARSHGASG